MKTDLVSPTDTPQDHVNPSPVPINPSLPQSSPQTTANTQNYPRPTTIEAIDPKESNNLLGFDGRLRSTSIDDIATDNPMTPLMKACLNGDLETVRGLLAKGVNPNATDNSGKTAFFYAVNSSSVHFNQLITQLTVSGGNMNTRCDNGQSFIDFALQLGKRQVIDCVINLIDASSKEGKNTIGLLIRIDDEEIRAKLRENLGSKHFKYFDNKFRKKLKKGCNSVKSMTSSCKSLSLAKISLKRDLIEPKSELSLGRVDKKRVNANKIGSNYVDDWLSGEKASYYLSESNSKARRKTEVTEDKGWGGLVTTSGQGIASPGNKGWLDDEQDGEGDGVFTFKTTEQLKRKGKAEKNDANNLKVQSNPTIAPFTSSKPGDWMADSKPKLTPKAPSPNNQETHDKISALVSVK